MSGFQEQRNIQPSARRVNRLIGINPVRIIRRNKMVEKKCLDCKISISHRGWMAKRCEKCSHKRLLGLQKKYRETHKEEIKKYQEKYYNRK